MSDVNDSSGKNEDGKLLYCSFCGKSQHEVRKLIAGPVGLLFATNVSNCVTTSFAKKCEDQSPEPAVEASLPKPKEINEYSG